MNQRSPVEVRQLVSNRVSNRVHACKMVCRCWEAGSIRPIVNLSFCSSDLPSEGPLYLLIVGRIKVRRTSHGQYWTKEQKGVSVKLLHLFQKYFSTSEKSFFFKNAKCLTWRLDKCKFPRLLLIFISFPSFDHCILLWAIQDFETPQKCFHQRFFRL